MEHVDPEVLALAALGEPVDDATRAHLEACASCAAEVAELASVVTTARTVTPEDAPVPAPAGVWGRIHAELDLSPGLAPDGETAPVAPVASVPVAPEDSTTTASGSAPAPPSTTPEDDSPSNVVPLRRRRAPWVMAAAAAGVVVGGVGGAVWGGGLLDSEVPAPVVAEAALDPLPGWDATGAAQVHEADDGTRQIVVSLDTSDDADGYREVWLIDREVTRLVSLGVLEGSEGTFTVPSGLDLDDFAVVDVSAEPYDGDPNHSGDSIIRGILDV
ncbi:anti-sigma factor domain-containing protein [Actinotalea sp. C106]|uniref:anti-sigma factor n=1 Tax=Actinotalea sp. C106 TaxID=2908644 RepID=UPI002028C5A4|nr:anti-sigma factor [Actinotalea sp. C106]